MAPSTSSESHPHHLVLYDGVCGLCNRLNQFVLKRDRRDEFQFASLQGDLARGIVRRYGKNPDDLDTFYIVADFRGPGERLLAKAAAALFVLSRIGSGWKLTQALRILPTFVLNAGYDFIAQRRYRWFGKFDQCMLPEPHHRTKFLEP